MGLPAEEQPLCCLPRGWVGQAVAAVGWMPCGKGVMAVGLPCLLWHGKGWCLVQLAWHLQEHPKVHLSAICPQIWGFSC